MYCSVVCTLFLAIPRGIKSHSQLAQKINSSRPRKKRKKHFNNSEEKTKYNNNKERGKNVRQDIRAGVEESMKIVPLAILLTLRAISKYSYYSYVSMIF